MLLCPKCLNKLEEEPLDESGRLKWCKTCGTYRFLGGSGVPEKA